MAAGYPVVVKDNLGNDVDYSGPALTGARYNTSPPIQTSGALVENQCDRYGAVRTSLIGAREGIEVRTFIGNANWFRYAGSPGTTGLFGTDALLGVASYSGLWDSTQGGARRQAAPNKTFRLPSSGADTVNALISSTAGTAAFRLSGYNAKASTVWIKLYNKATTPTGADTPILVFAAAANAPFNFSLDHFVFQLGLGLRATTDASDIGSTALAAADLLNLQVTYDG